MVNKYKVTGVNKKMQHIDVEVVAHNETEAIMQVQMKYGEGNYKAKLISGRLYG